MWIAKAVLIHIVRFLVAILLVTVCSRVNAQVYPVQISVNIMPPVGVSLAEFQRSNPGRLQGTLILTDLNRPVFRVRLRLIIQGQNFTLRTRESAFFPPLNLQAGQPVSLDQSVLLPYFNIDNLEVLGVDREQFIRRGMRMPEGPYSFCLEAVDYNRPEGLSVSNTACAVSMVEEYDPPLLMQPDFTNQLLFENQPPEFQQALFTWQPQHTGVFPVEYELRIFRGAPAMKDLPGNVIREHTPPYIRVKTISTFYNLSPLDPPLLRDERYYAEVQIFPIGYPAIFKNNGTSPFIQFYAGSEESSNCTAPLELQGTGLRQGIFLQWKNYNYCAEYITHYYDEAAPHNQYQSTLLRQNYSLSDTITKISSNRNYIIRTGCKCGLDTLYSDTIRIAFSRPKAQVPPYACGIETPMEAPLPELLRELQKDDTIIAADLKVIVRKAQGTDGIFTGIGHIEVPHFKYARVNAVFDHITVNDEYRMIRGEIKVIGVGQNILSDELVEMLNEITDGLDTLNERLDDGITVLDTLNAIRDLLDENIPPWLIDSIKQIQDLIAQTEDDGERERLEKILEDLNKKKQEWELMYINMVLSMVEEKFEECDSLKSSIENNYNEKASVFKDVTLIGGPDRAPPKIDQLDKKDLGVKIVKINRSTLTENFPEMTTKYTNYLAARKNYAECTLIDKINTEIKGNNNTVKFALNLKRVGADIIGPMRAIFERHDWDVEAIHADVGLREEVREILNNAITKLYYKL